MTPAHDSQKTGAMNAGQVLWIGGWAVPPAAGLAEVRQVWPHVEHIWWLPDPHEFCQRLSHELSRSAIQCVCGYSLGAHLLLAALAEGVDIRQAVVLYAPFVDLRLESGLGGRVRATRMRYLHRWLSRDRDAAIMDFYRRSGLDYTPPPKDVYPDNVMLRGMDSLLQPRLCGWPNLPPGAKGVVGARDPLVDVVLLQPPIAVDVISNAGHRLRDLITGSGGFSAKGMLA